MPWITVVAKEALIDEELERLEIEAKSDEYIWTNKAIRTEDIMEFYRRTPATTVVSFYDDRRKLFIREGYEEFFARIEDMDYELMDAELIIGGGEEEETHKTD